MLSMHVPKVQQRLARADEAAQVGVLPTLGTVARALCFHPCYGMIGEAAACTEDHNKGDLFQDSQAAHRIPPERWRPWSFQGPAPSLGSNRGAITRFQASVCPMIDTAFHEKRI